MEVEGGGAKTWKRGLSHKISISTEPSDGLVSSSLFKVGYGLSYKYVLNLSFANF